MLYGAEPTGDVGKTVIYMEFNSINVDNEFCVDCLFAKIRGGENFTLYRVHACVGVFHAVSLCSFGFGAGIRLPARRIFWE